MARMAKTAQPRIERHVPHDGLAHQPPGTRVHRLPHASARDVHVSAAISLACYRLAAAAGGVGALVPYWPPRAGYQQVGAAVAQP